jgi:hypothetical protein
LQVAGAVAAVPKQQIMLAEAGEALEDYCPEILLYQLQEILS